MYRIKKPSKTYYIVTSDFYFTISNLDDIKDGDIVIHFTVHNSMITYYFELKSNDNVFIPLAETNTEDKLRETYDIAVNKTRMLKLKRLKNGNKDINM